MNILLSYPEFTATFWSFKPALKLVHNKASSSPLGLLKVTVMLPAKWHKHMIDLYVGNLTVKGKPWAGAVFVSGMPVQKEAVPWLSYRNQ